jgi:DNA-binding ferritin-like protein
MFSIIKKERLRRQNLHDGDREKKHISSAMIESLVIALNGNSEEITERYSLMHKLPVYPENVELLKEELKALDEIYKKELTKMRAGGGDSSELNDENTPDLELFLKYEERHASENKKRFEDMTERLKKIGSDLRIQTIERIEQLIDEAEASSKKMGQLWELRENYRLDVEKKNASLAALMKRAADAVQTIKDLENPPDPKAKKKK